MQEWDSVEKDQSEGEPLEKHLKAYYGPQIQEQPLPYSSWLNVRNKLGSQRSARLRGRRYQLRPQRRARIWSAPQEIRDAFTLIVYEARIPWKLPVLRCTYNSQVREPALHVSLVGGHVIKLQLPSSSERAIDRAGLDVLLATGLARYAYMRRPFIAFMRFIVLLLILLCVLGLFEFELMSKSRWVYLIAIVLLPAAVGILHIVGRTVAFRADKLVIKWLGRNRTCSGLHALADQSSAPRSKGWREPSLMERIERVCGTGVEIKDKHFTLVG